METLADVENPKSKAQSGVMLESSAACCQRNTASRRGLCVRRQELARQLDIQRKQCANRIARRQVIFVRAVVIDAVVLDGARDSSRRRLPTRGFVDELLRGYQPNQITR